jgi:hypothetical protein
VEGATPSNPTPTPTPAIFGFFAFETPPPVNLVGQTFLSAQNQPSKLQSTLAAGRNKMYALAPPLLLLALLLSTSLGCRNYVAVTARAIDADNGRPLVGASVWNNSAMALTATDAWISLLFGAPDIDQSITTTGADGRATIRILDHQAYKRALAARADGYITSGAPLTPEQFEAIKRRHGPPKEPDLSIPLHRKDATPHP